MTDGKYVYAIGTQDPIVPISIFSSFKRAKDAAKEESCKPGRFGGNYNQRVFVFKIKLNSISVLGKTRFILKSYHNGEEVK